MNKNELTIWAEKALSFYNKTAPVIDLSFYQFQKPADFDNECELLLIGLNPGGESGWDFASQYNNNNKEWKPYFNGQEMTIEGFLGGNPTSSYQSIMKGLSYIGLPGSKHWQFINWVPFSTHDVKELYRKVSKDVRDQCLELTLEYIRLLSPKKIIVMGTANGIDKFPEEIRRECKILLKGRVRYIVRTNLCGISTFVIPHPSFPNWPKEARDKMTEMIQLYLDGREDEIEPVSL